MIKTAIFTAVFAHRFIFLPYSPIAIIMPFTSIYNTSSFSLCVADFTFMGTNNVVLILIFHNYPPGTIVSIKRSRS